MGRTTDAVRPHRPPPRRRPLRARTIAALVVLAGAVGACGGGAEGDGLPETAEQSLPREGLHGRAPASEAGIPSVILLRNLEAEAGAPDPPPFPEPLIDQFGLTFSPRLLVVRVATPLTFTNSEGALTHNVHLRSVDRNESVFNEDTNSGDAIRATLTESGGYDVLCDMHPGMAAFVFVTDAPYTVFAEAEGSFTLGRVPPGAYEIRTWTRAAGYGPADTVSVAGTFTEVDLSGLR